MSLMTLPAPSTPLAVVKKKLNGIRGARTAKTSVDRASFFMLHLYRSNLEVRLRSIEPSSLQTEGQREIFATVTGMLKARHPARSSGDFEWDEVYKIERLIVLLYSGPQLRQEINARLQELAGDDLKEAESMR